MLLRNTTLVMGVLCCMLFSIFALSGVLYDAVAWGWYALGLFIYGNAYSVAVILLAYNHFIFARPGRMLLLSFVLVFIPMVLFSIALWIIAFY